MGSPFGWVFFYFTVVSYQRFVVTPPVTSPVVPPLNLVFAGHCHCIRILQIRRRCRRITGKERTKHQNTREQKQPIDRNNYSFHSISPLDQKQTA